MSNKHVPNCGQLTWKARDQRSLDSVEPESELWKFAESWLKRFLDAHEDSPAEKFIFLWVTVNAWLSMVVPDRTKNHDDSYLIHSMAIDSRFLSLFSDLLKNDPDFKKNIEELSALAPVFQVLWLRNKHIAPWNNKSESRRDFIERVKHEDPYHRIRDKQGQEKVHPAFAPACTLEHLDVEDLVSTASLLSQK